jgi:hypothetical protein
MTNTVWAPRLLDLNLFRAAVRQINATLD